MVGYGSDSRRVRGYKYGGDTGRVGVGSHGMSPAGGGGQAGTTSGRGGGPEGAARPKNRPQALPTIAPVADAPTPPLEALRQASDLQNYFSDLQNIALGGQAAQSALARFGIAPEQSYFQYRGSFPEFGDLSGTSGGLAGIIRSLGKMSRTPESFAEGGRAGESMGRRDIQTDVGKFGQMLRDLMLMTDEPTGRQAERLAMAEEAGYISPAIAQREGNLYQPGGLMPRVAETIEVSPLPPPGMSRERTQRERELARVRREGNLYQPGGLMPRVAETGSPRYGGDAEAFRFVMPPRDNSPLNIILDGARPVAPAESTPTEEKPEPRLTYELILDRLGRDAADLFEQDPAVFYDYYEDYLDSLRDLRSMTDEPTGMSREMTQRERELSRSRRMSQAERDLMEAVRNEPELILDRLGQDAADLFEQDPAVFYDYYEDNLDSLIPGEKPEIDYKPEIFNFIGREEGSESEGYTLNITKYPNAGVTIANGLDLGQQDEDSLRRMGLTDDLIELFTPYLGLQGADAKAFLEENPLSISPEQKSFVEDKLNEYDYKRFSTFWNSSETYAPWENLKPEQKAVLLSVFRQYGNLPGRTPNFWEYSSTGDWDGVLRELRDFKDDFGPRRVREANLLEYGFAKGGPVSRRPFPGLLLDNPQRTATVEEAIRDMMESRGLTQEEAVEELQAMSRKSYPMSDTSPDGFKNGGETRRPFPGLLLDNPQRTATVEEVIRDMMESRGLTQEEAVKELQARFRKSYPMSDTVPDYSFAGGGSVRGRRDALPLVEGDHVVPAHAVKGNEGGLASLSRRLSGNPSYDGMIRGPGGPRDDAIKTRVYAAGGGISGMMDNLQNPFNSVPARVSNKEYVIPRDAINNLGRMAGAPEGMANKAGQDIIYQLVENLKRKA